MSLWGCVNQNCSGGVYGPGLVCPRCGKQGSRVVKIDPPVPLNAELQALLARVEKEGLT